MCTEEIWWYFIGNTLSNQSCLRGKWDLISGPHVKTCIQNNLENFLILYFLVNIIIGNRNTSMPHIITTTEM